MGIGNLRQCSKEETVAEVQTREELLERVRARHAEMEDLLSTLSEAQLTARILDAGWSIKDVLSHLVAWQEMMLGWIESGQRGIQPVRYTADFREVDHDREGTIDRLNDYLFQQNRDKPLETVLAEFRATHARVLQALSALTDQEIFDPHRYPWRRGVALLPLIGGNTYAHYEEHLAWIRQALARL